MRNLATVLQIAGMAVLVVGTFLLLGVASAAVVAGFSLLVTGVVLEREHA